MISRSITCAELFRSFLWPSCEWVRAALNSVSTVYGGFCLLHVWKRCSLDINQWRLDHNGGFHRKGSYVHYRLISFIVWVEESTLIRAQKLDARNFGAVLITKRVWRFFCCSSAILCVSLSFITFWKMLELKVNLLHSFIHDCCFFLGIVVPLCAAAPSSLEKHFIDESFYYWSPGCGYMWEPRRS